MSAINPFHLAPDGDPDFATDYWRAVLCQSTYMPTDAELRALLVLLGAVSVSKIQFPLPSPEFVWFALWPDNRCVVVTQGTNDLRQLVAQILGATLQVSSLWPGKVSSYDAAATLLIRSALAAHLMPEHPTGIVYVGDSLGGAISCLLAAATDPAINLGAWTCGQPRVGNGFFALGYSSPLVRYTTSGDPVPMLPPSFNGLVNETLWPFWDVLLPSYVHVGTRRHVYPSGEVVNLPEAPSWSEGEQYLLANVQNNTFWYAAHFASTYACRIRAGIPVGFQVANADWPLLNAVDTIYAGILATFERACGGDLSTSLTAESAAAGKYATEGICT